MTDQANAPTPERAPPDAKTARSNRLPLLAAIAVAFALGAGGTAIFHKSRDVPFIALPPAPIGSMTADATAAIQGKVAEIFGNKFVVQDASGRALVETGRRGEGGDLVVKDETVTVQGRFAHGFVHAIAIRHADGRTDTLDTPPPPHPREALILR